MELILIGAPERILPLCSRFLVDGSEEGFGAEAMEKVSADSAKYGLEGKRTLVIASVYLDPGRFTKSPMYEFDLQGFPQWMRGVQNARSIPGWFPINELTFHGLIALESELSPNVEEFIARCRDKQIKMVMASGDHAATSAAIA